MQRLWRMWAKRAAIAVAVFVAINVAMVGGSLLLGSVTAPIAPGAPRGAGTRGARDRAYRKRRQTTRR